MKIRNMFSKICTDNLTLFKNSGEQIDNISAFVQGDKIILDDSSLPIEEGDKLERNLPNGLTESYLVVDRGYCESIGGIAAHYSVSVEKESKIKKQDSASTVYNVVGDHVRFNTNSNDNSVNMTIKTINETNVFENLREVIDNNVNGDEKEFLMLSIDELEQTKGTEKYTKVYSRFMQTAKDWMQIIAPFVPALSSLL